VFHHGPLDPGTVSASSPAISVPARPSHLRRHLRRALGLTLFATLSCTALSDKHLPMTTATAASVPAAIPAIHAAEDTGVRFIEIDVLSYNVQGLPWPLRGDAAEAQAVIGRQLGQLRERGVAPAIVLIQEGFVPEADTIGRLGGYAYSVAGPTIDDANIRPLEADDTALAAGANWTTGEASGPVLNSGLLAFSDYPITERRTAAFGRHACAGFDCLASKGALAFQVEIPGLPGPVAVFNTHLNANRASGATLERALAAHRLQIDRLSAFLGETLNPADALIFGGDFNIKRHPGRGEHAEARLRDLYTVHHHCATDAACDFKFPVSKDARWWEPRDLQGFRNGAAISVRPVASAPLFDQPVDGRMLSDHIGYLVRYRLSWNAGETITAQAY